MALLRVSAVASAINLSSGVLSAPRPRQCPSPPRMQVGVLRVRNGATWTRADLAYLLADC